MVFCGIMKTTSRLGIQYIENTSRVDVEFHKNNAGLDAQNMKHIVVFDWQYAGLTSGLTILCEENT